MSRLTLPHERNVDYKAIAAMANKDVKADILKDEQSFVAIYQDFCLDVLDHIKAQPLDERKALDKFFDSPGVFDGFVNVLVQQLHNKPMRPHLCCKKQR